MIAAQLWDEPGIVIVDTIGQRHVQQVPGLPVWKIKKASWHSWGKYDVRKQRLLAIVLQASNDTFLIYDEDPSEDGLVGTWSSVGTNIWQIPRGVDLAELYRWLSLGSWDIYCGGIHTGPGVPYNAFRNPKLVIEHMEAMEMSMLVSSFHDNDPWLIGVMPRITEG